MVHERDIREQLAFLIGGEVSLAAFERWLASESRNMFNDSPNAVPLIAAVNLLISEFHDNIINEKEFRAELLPLVNNIQAALVFDENLDPVEIASPFTAVEAQWTPVPLIVRVA